MASAAGWPGGGTLPATAARPPSSVEIRPLCCNLSQKASSCNTIPAPPPFCFCALSTCSEMDAFLTACPHLCSMVVQTEDPYTGEACAQHFGWVKRVGSRGHSGCLQGSSRGLACAVRRLAAFRRCHRCLPDPLPFCRSPLCVLPSPQRWRGTVLENLLRMCFQSSCLVCLAGGPKCQRCENDCPHKSVRAEGSGAGGLTCGALCGVRHAQEGASRPHFTEAPTLPMSHPAPDLTLPVFPTLHVYTPTVSAPLVPPNPPAAPLPPSTDASRCW